MQDVLANSGVKAPDGSGWQFQVSILVTGNAADVYVVHIGTCWSELAQGDIETLLAVAVAPESSACCGPSWEWVVVTVRDPLVTLVTRNDMC